MIIRTVDNKKIAELGTSDILYSVYSTVEVRLGKLKKSIPLALDFLASGKCSASNAIETARQFNLIRDELSKIPPEKAVYDMSDLKKPAPWLGNLSPVVTSCANLYTTSDGKDLLYEIVCVLVCGGYSGSDVELQ